MPSLRGRPLEFGFLPELRTAKGQLRSGGDAGTEVHAGSFIHRREVVLESGLAAHPSELARVLVHELFHFIWLRAGNPVRRSYEVLLENEMIRQAWGELGWSAESRKRSLRIRDRLRRSRRWREYVCESFCDSAAWLLAGLRAHEEFTLTVRHRRARREWFRRVLARDEISI
jgi:hypothetical protein